MRPTWGSAARGSTRHLVEPLSLHTVIRLVGVMELKVDAARPACHKQVSLTHFPPFPRGVTAATCESCQIQVTR